MLARAAAQPTTLVIGIDAVASALAVSSARAARPARKGGLANALFAVASAEAPPPELLGRVPELTVLFPWGSLLRGVVGVDPAAAAGLAGLLAPEGRLVALVATHPRDRLADIPCAGQLLADPSPLGRRWEEYGLTLCSLRAATAAEARATGSSWARRLATGRLRTVARIELNRNR
ncbi:MAG TPA: hypothetical protein VFK54_06105 [Candidatus Limnocylindrales bacterium]|nr:hypothetical protein [Candidatus Limnocylindrales bacterium]